MAPGQGGLDGRLALQQPVQRGVEFVLVDLTKTEHLAQARGGGGARQRTSGGKLGGWIEDPAKQQGEDKVTATIAIGTEDTVETDLACHAQSCGDVAVWQAPCDGERVLAGGDDGAAPENAAQAFDVSDRPVGQIAQGSLADLAVLPVALAQQYGGRRTSVWDGFDIHGAMPAQIAEGYKHQKLEYMATDQAPSE